MADERDETLPIRGRTSDILYISIGEFDRRIFSNAARSADMVAEQSADDSRKGITDNLLTTIDLLQK